MFENCIVDNVSCKGQIDKYVMLIAGILANNTDWQEEKINQFCFDLALSQAQKIHHDMQLKEQMQKEKN